MRAARRSQTRCMRRSKSAEGDWAASGGGRHGRRHASFPPQEEEEEEMDDAVTAQLLFMMSLFSLLWHQGSYAEVAGYHTRLRIARLAPAARRSPGLCGSFGGDSRSVCGIAMICTTTLVMSRPTSTQKSSFR